MSKLYLDSGYLNIATIIEDAAPFTFVVGGRGIGKTYGALEYMIQNGKTFMLLRRTQSQTDIINKPEFSPFKRLNADHGWNIVTTPLTKYNSGFYWGEEDEKGGLKPTGPAIGYTAALSTFSNIRGFDASDVEYMIFDEFIPESHERPLKNEFAALMNCYETVNRNRELQGSKPVKLLCMANANDIANPCFIGLNLIKRVTTMFEKGSEYWYDEKRGISIYIVQRSPISEKKSGTALYMLNQDSAFSEMSLKNAFSANQPSAIATRQLKEYRLIFGIGEIYVYRHKSNGTYYISTHRTGTAPYYGESRADIMRVKRQYGWLWTAYLHGKIIFEEYLCEILLTRIFK